MSMHGIRWLALLCTGLMLAGCPRSKDSEQRTDAGNPPQTDGGTTQPPGDDGGVPPGRDGGTSTGQVCAISTSCAPGLTECRQHTTDDVPGRCVDLQRSNMDCGACNNVCAADQRCESGQCVAQVIACSADARCPFGLRCQEGRCRPAARQASQCLPGEVFHQDSKTCFCPGNMQFCDSRCTPLDDPLNCGGRCEACPAPSNADPRCVDRKCDFTCKPGFRLCGSGCRPDAEVTRRPVEVQLGGLVRSLAVGDFNGDGLSDVAAVLGDYQQKVESRLWILHGTAGGGLAKSVSFPLEDYLHEVIVADANQDGWQDVLVGRWYGGYVRFFWNEQGQGFRAEDSGIVMDDAKVMVVRDLDGDGKVDLLIGGQELPGAGVVMFRGQGSGRFGQRTYIQTDCLDSDSYYMEAHDVVPADFDGDGVIDLAVGHRGPHFTTVRGLGGGRFSQPQCYADQAGAVAAMDLDEDGDLDVIGRTGIVRNDGRGGFEPAERIESNGSPVWWYGIPMAVADIDHDGEVDLISAPSGKRRVELWRGLGGGRFESPSYFQVDTEVLDLALIDIDADGTSEVLVGNDTSGLTIVPLGCE